MQRYDLASREDIIANSSDVNQSNIKKKFELTPSLNVTKKRLTTEVDFRVLSCIQTIDSLVTDDNVTLTKLSRASFLSESRLSHLFKDQVGISIHQYILWKKILLAVSKSKEGYSLTECAHYAGFSDSSHFNKVFSKMFGVNPFFVLKN
jgi:AraC-like DNA-binding protein